MGVGTPNIPVMPYLLPDRAIVSLLALGPAERMRRSEVVPMTRRTDIPVMTSESDFMSAGFAAELGFAGIVSITASADAKYILRETQIVTEIVNRSTDPSTDIKTEYYGLAIRTGVTAWNFKSTTKVTFEELVAQATLNTAQTAMQVQAVGMGIQALPPMITNFGAVSAGVTTGAFQSLALIEQAFWDYTVENWNRLTPVLLGVDLKDEVMDRIWGRASSVYYGNFGIMWGRTCEEVVTPPQGAYYNPATLPPLDVPHVEAIYRAIVGADKRLIPTVADKDQAKRTSFSYDEK